jgi:hypothetical protein
VDVEFTASRFSVDSDARFVDNCKLLVISGDDRLEEVVGDELDEFLSEGLVTDEYVKFVGDEIALSNERRKRGSERIDLSHGIYREAQIIQLISLQRPEKCKFVIKNVKFNVNHG